jgi:hypothetical protein
MSRRCSIQLPAARRSGGYDELDITLHLTRRLLEVQSDNLQLRRELNRSRLHLHELKKQLRAQVAQVKELVVSMREFIHLHRSAPSDADDSTTDAATASTVSIDYHTDHEAAPSPRGP